MFATTHALAMLFCMACSASAMVTVRPITTDAGTYCLKVESPDGDFPASWLPDLCTPTARTPGALWTGSTAFPALLDRAGSVLYFVDGDAQDNDVLVAVDLTTGTARRRGLPTMGMVTSLHAGANTMTIVVLGVMAKEQRIAGAQQQQRAGPFIRMAQLRGGKTPPPSVFASPIPYNQVVFEVDTATLRLRAPPTVYPSGVDAGQTMACLGCGSAYDARTGTAYGMVVKQACPPAGCFISATGCGAECDPAHGGYCCADPAADPGSHTCYSQPCRDIGKTTQAFYNAINVRSGEVAPMVNLLAGFPTSEVYDFAVGTLGARPVVFAQAASLVDKANTLFNRSLLAFDGNTTVAAAAGVRAAVVHRYAPAYDGAMTYFNGPNIFPDMSVGHLNCTGTMAGACEGGDGGDDGGILRVWKLLLRDGTKAANATSFAYDWVGADVSGVGRAPLVVPRACVAKGAGEVVDGSVVCGFPVHAF
jgi:hypothetical protein